MAHQRPVPLATLRGEVLRFSGVVDRFGSFAGQGSTTHTLCVRSLQLANSGQKIDLDHAWFRLRQVWTQAGVKVGDTVLFTAKVQHCSKGWDNPDQPADKQRRQVVGFGTGPRDVVVLRRKQTHARVVTDLQAELQGHELRLADLQSHCDRLEAQRSELLSQTATLQRQAHSTTAVIGRLRRRVWLAAAGALFVGSITGGTLAWTAAPRSEAGGGAHLPSLQR